MSVLKICRKSNRNVHLAPCPDRMEEFLAVRRKKVSFQECLLWLHQDGSSLRPSWKQQHVGPKIMKKQSIFLPNRLRDSLHGAPQLWPIAQVSRDFLKNKFALYSRVKGKSGDAAKMLTCLANSLGRGDPLNIRATDLHPVHQPAQESSVTFSTLSCSCTGWSIRLYTMFC